MWGRLVVHNLKLAFVLLCTIHADCLPGPSKRPKLSAIETYREYLFDIYNVRQLPADDKWHCLDSIKHFVNLECADISKHMDRKKIEESWEMIVRGHMSDVPREQITIDQIACKLDGSLPKLVLIKGAPGVGKTTLSWELCRRWSRGELWTDYSLVILLRLQDENIQKAKNTSDLFPLEESSAHTCISQSIELGIQSTRGQGVLFILEGLDELPQIYREDKNSIFMKLITGRLLPASTVLVTTRPWAVSDLPKSCSSRLDQLIEILGFLEKQIKEYVSKMVSDKEAPAELQAYVDTNPHISSAMYNPLYARIVVEVYREFYDTSSKSKVLPNTTTELYTAYSQILIERHLSDHPVEEEWNGDLWKLPQSLQPQFNHLCKIAYQGITKENRQLVFFKEDVPDGSNTLGFMNSVHPLYGSVLRTMSPSYNFIHLTLQEFLAAVHLWRNYTPQKQLILFETKCDGQYSTILQFLAGLTKLNDPWTRCVLPVPELAGEYSMTKVFCLSDYHIKWLYESQNVELIKTVSCGDVTYDLHSLDPQLIIALGYVLANGKFQVRLTLDHGNFTSVKNLVEGLKRYNSCSSQLRHLTIHMNFDSQTASHLVQFIKPTVVPGPSLHITTGSMFIRYSKEIESSVSKLIQLVEETVEEIEFDGCITDNILSELAKKLKQTSNLKKLKLACSEPTDIFDYCNNKYLSDFVMSSQALQTLQFSLLNGWLSGSRIGWVTFGLSVARFKQMNLPIYKPDEYGQKKGDNYSLQESIIQSFANELEFFLSTGFNDVAQLNSFFQAIFSCPNLKRFGVFQFSACDFQHQDICLEGLSAHTSIQTLHLAYYPGLACKIFQALQRNTSVKCLRIDVEFEDDIAKDFVGLLSSNKSIQEIEVTVSPDASSECTVTNRDAFIVMMEEVANAKHLKKVGIWYHWYKFDYTASIGQAVCKVIRDNTTLQYLKIPLFLPQDESFLQPIAETLCKNSTLQILILKPAFCNYLSEPSRFYAEDEKFEDILFAMEAECRYTLSNEEAEALCEMLEVNKSLQIFHLPADLSDSTCSLIIRALSVNNTIEEFRINKNIKKIAIKCKDYLLARRKTAFADCDNTDLEGPLYEVKPRLPQRRCRCNIC